MAAFTEKPTDLNSAHDDVIDDGGDRIDKSSLTDSKPETESDHKPKSEPEFDQMKNLAATSKKLNPEAKEFFPSYMKNNNNQSHDCMIATKPSGEEFNADNERHGINRTGLQRRNSYNEGRVRLTGSASKAQREESIRRTVYVSGFDQSVTEEFLVGLFSSCGQVVDSRICGDTSLVLRFAFVEFSDDQGARAALSLDGTMIGCYSVSVFPAKAPILPVNPTFLPRSEDEIEMCNRTIYCTNVDKVANKNDIKTSGEESNAGNEINGINRRRRNNNWRSGRDSKYQREDSVRRTVYVSDIDQSVTEEFLAGLFSSYGQVVDCRICGNTDSVLPFAFVEFSDDQGARAALSLSGTIIGCYSVRVLPSKTAILPVTPTYLPRSEDEREMCNRTIYCTNIDKNVTNYDVKTFFQFTCGEVTRFRLLGDALHSTRTAFVEFAMAESAIAALNCSGTVLGSQSIRVSPSKTPVRSWKKDSSSPPSLLPLPNLGETDSNHEHAS